MNGRIPPRTLIIAVVATLFGLFLLSAAYSSGVADGMIQSGRAGSGAVVPGGFTPAHGVTYGLGWGFGLIFGLFGFLIKLVFLLAIFAIIARLVFGRHIGRNWKGNWGGGNPLEDWHRRAHKAESPVSPPTETL